MMSRDVRRNVLCVLTCLVLALLKTAASQETARKVLFDFEKAPLGEAWVASGPVRASREAQDQPREGQQAVQGAQALRVVATGPGGVYTRPGAVPGDWSATQTISFQARPVKGDGAAGPVVIELQLIEADGRTRFWRKIELDRAAWQRVEIRPPWMRWSDGRVPQWDRIARLGFFVRGAGEVWVDDVAVTAGRAGAAEWSQEELAEAAFGSPVPASVRIAKTDSALLLTDASDLDTDVLTGQLAKAALMLQEDFPHVKGRIRPVPLVIFAKADEYRRFPPRLARKLGSEGPEPQSDGFTMQGVATSAWSASAGSARPVYVHEYVHALAGQAMRLPNKGEWLQEGLASLYQVRLFPQDNLGQIVRQGLGDVRYRLPMQALLNGQRIPMNRYWQALTVVEWLLTDPATKAKLPALLEAMAKAGSTDLAPHVEGVLGTTWADLEAQWRTHCDARYGARAASRPAK